MLSLTLPLGFRRCAGAFFGSVSLRTTSHCPVGAFLVAMPGVVWMVALGVSIFCLAGCGRQEEVMLVRMYLEAPTEGVGERMTFPVTLPRSGLSYAVYRQPVLLERMIVQVDRARVASGRVALRFVLDDEGRRELYRLSVSQRGRAIVTTINSVPVGVRVLDGTIEDGVFFTFVEVDGEELEALAVALQENAVKVREIAAKRSMLR